MMTFLIKYKRFFCLLMAFVMAFSFFTLPVRAEALLMACASVVLGLAIGAIAELSGQLISKGIEAGIEYTETAIDHWQLIFNNLAQNDSAIQVQYDFPEGGDFDPRYVYPNSSLSGDELELATRICNTINNSGNLNSYLSYDVLSGTLVLSVEGYESLKKIAVNAWLYEIQSEGATILDEAVDMPTYDFDFIGPIQGLAVPVGEKRISLSKNGYTFSAPISHPSSKGFSKIQVESLGLNAYQLSSDGNYCAVVTTDSITCYSGSQYVIFNGEIYYRTSFNSTSSAYSRTLVLPSFYSTTGEYNGTMSSMISASGVALSSVASVSDIPSMYVGYMYSTTYTGYANPSEFDPSDLITSTDGAEFDLSLNDGENTISNALSMGLISPGDLLTIDSNGNIVAADNIPIEKLQEIFDAVKDGTLELDDVQEYLQTITQLIGASNLNATEQKSLIENINSNIQSISDAITSDVALDSDLDIDKPDIDFSLISVEHSGFYESKTLVESALPIVGQSRKLINNLFSESSFNGAPTFSFYWDSNSDGVVEKYTVLDLSFMETRLTNSNLSDKNRFKKSMTVREFVQQLIILISYVTFAIKVLKKIPGLVGYGESGLSFSSSKDV